MHIASPTKPPRDAVITSVIAADTSAAPNQKRRRSPRDATAAATMAGEEHDDVGRVLVGFADRARGAAVDRGCGTRG